MTVDQILTLEPALNWFQSGVDCELRQRTHGHLRAVTHPGESGQFVEAVLGHDAPHGA